MDISILRTADRRSLGKRNWDTLYFGYQKGRLSVGPNMWFQWDVHEHRGGAGGLKLSEKREEVKTLARKLIQNPGNRPVTLDAFVRFSENFSKNFPDHPN